MIDFTDVLVVMGMFALRVGVPAAIIALAVYWLKRLDQRWEAEARAERALTKRAEPVRPATRPQPQTRPAAEAQPGLAVATGEPCWDVNACPEGMKANCPAYKNPEQACWQARLQAEGKIPENCVTCEVFQRYPVN